MARTQQATTAAPRGERGSGPQLARPARRASRERALLGLLLGLTLISIVVLAVLLVDIFLDGAGRLNWQFLTGTASRFPEDTGIFPPLTGTLSLMLLTVLLAFPLGVGAALYLEEFAPDNRFTRLLEVNIGNLAGVPSVIYGLLGAAAFVYFLEFGRSLLAGAWTLALLALPVIIVASREALRSVPRAIRQAGLALGATRWQVTWRTVLPAAMGGIMTGTILALSRAIGEAAPIIAVGAYFSRLFPNEPWNVFEAFSALPVEIFDFVKRPQEGFKVEASAAAIIVLLVLLLAMNSVAVFIRHRFSRKVS